jgi:subtilisin family serine protease/subtilisin-like proprotein convertase family protein
MVADPRRARLRLDELEGRDVPATVAPIEPAIDHASYDPTHVLVKWNDGLAHNTKYSQAADPLGNGLYRLTLNSGVSVSQAITGITAAGRIAVVQPDYLVSIDRLPDDPSMGSLWGLDNTGQNGGTANADISAPEAWNTSTGTRHTIVAIVDTGVDYKHPDLAANMWHNPRGSGDGLYGWNFINNSGNVMDDNGHGTHVAGTIGAVGNNGIGVVGVDWNTQIMALKFLDSTGTGYLSNAVKAINYAVAHGANVINASFGGGGYDAAMAIAIANAKAHGVIVVAAAGNDGTNNDTSPEYPAGYSGDNVIAVAATDRNDRLASFSNYGPNSVDIAAPGVSIYSTLPGGKYGTYSGTSMAAPHVTGAIALIWDAHPSWNYRQVVIAILHSTDDIPSLDGKIAHGRLDVAKAIAYSFDTPTKDTTGANITNAIFSGSGSTINQVRLTFSEAINPATFSTGDVKLGGPSGNAITVSGVKAVAGSGNTQFDVTFPAQSAPGTYKLTVGPDIRDTAGNQMDQDKDGRNGLPGDKFITSNVFSSTGTFASSNVGQPILDFIPVRSTLKITKDITIKDLSVQVNASHTYDGDLRITLIAPDGTKVILFNRRGGSGQGLNNTVFDDGGVNSIYRGAAPFAGSYKPEYLLSTFDGKNAKGTWQLLIEDNALLDTGRLIGWSLKIEGAQKAAGATAVTSQTPALAPAPVMAASLVSAPPVDWDGHVYVGPRRFFA